MSNKNIKEETTQNPRLGKVGGEAVIEGVMMKSGETCATACRREDGTVILSKRKFVSVRKSKKILNLPIIRGVVNFVETMKLSMSSLEIAADAAGVEEEETRFEKWLRRVFGVKLFDILTVIASILGVVLAIFLFMYLPGLAAKGLCALTNDAVKPVFALIEGFFKLAIFVGYIALVALMPDIRRTFMYHGAEHKSIACYESGEELTPANAKKHSRFHPRCGTSFMFVMIFLGILLGFLIPAELPAALRAGIKLLLLPIVVGVGYEFIMYAGKHDNFLVRVLSAPGLLMQRLTTREPDESMLEIAQIALRAAMPEEFPDFDTSCMTVVDLDTGERREPATETPEEKTAESETAFAPAENPDDAL